MDFAKNLQAIRKEAKLSQEDVAEKLHISRQAVSKWEMGQSSPDAETCAKLCEVLGVSPERLLLGIETPQNGAPPKNTRWTVLLVLYAVFLMVVCICGTVLLVCNLYNGEVFEPNMHKLALQMIRGAILVFSVSVMAGGVVFWKKRTKGLHRKK